MIATLSFAGLVLATIFAAVAAVVFNWLFLRVMFNLMRAAAVRGTPGSMATKRPTVRTELVRGTAQAAAQTITTSAGTRSNACPAKSRRPKPLQVSRHASLEEERQCFG